MFANNIVFGLAMYFSGRNAATSTDNKVNEDLPLQFNDLEINPESQSLLLRAEEELVQMGSYEPVNINVSSNNSTISDRENILRIDQLCKNFIKYDGK